MSTQNAGKTRAPASSSDVKGPTGEWKEGYFIYFGKLSEEDEQLIADHRLEAFDGLALLPEMTPYVELSDWLEALGANSLTQVSEQHMLSKVVSEYWTTPSFRAFFKADEHQDWEEVFEQKRNEIERKYRSSGQDLDREHRRKYDQEVSRFTRKRNAHEEAAKRRATFIKGRMPSSNKHGSWLTIRAQVDPQVFGLTSGQGVRLLVLVPCKSEAENLRIQLRNLREEESFKDEVADVSDTAAPELTEISSLPSSTAVDRAGTEALFPVEREKPFLQQQLIAERLVDAAKKALGGSDALSKYKKLAFLIICPRFTSLRSQTSSRVAKAGLVEEFKQDQWGTALKSASLRVVPHDKKCAEWGRFHELLKADQATQSTLFVIVDDECHFGPTKNGAHDEFVNFSKHPEALKYPNLLILQVSATPQNCLTRNTRVHEHNIVDWSYDSDALLGLPGAEQEAEQYNTNIYRSLDWYCESIQWRLVPSKDSPRVMKFVKPDRRATEIDTPHLASELENLAFHPFDFTNFAHMVTMVIDRTPGLQGVKLANANVDGLPRLQIIFPSTGWSLISNKFVRDVLGFGDEKDNEGVAITDAGGGIVGKRLPKLCDPSEGGTVPLAHQHIRSDESIKSMIVKWQSKNTRQQNQRIDDGDGDYDPADEKSKGNGSRGRKKAKAGKSAAGEIAEHEAHILVADYIVSLAYFAFFRVKDDFCPLTNAVEKERPEDGSILRALDTVQLNTDRVRAMLYALDAIKKDANQVKAEDGTCLKDFGNTLEFVMKDCEAEAKATFFEKTDAPKEEEIWEQIIEAKLESERVSANSNDRLSWFTESDRLIGTLLEVECPAVTGERRKGFMTFTRIYGTDRAHLLQRHLREAMRKLGLFYSVKDTRGNKMKRPIFAVVSDNGDVELSKEMAAEHWADVALSHDNDTVDRRFRGQSHATSSLGYEMLQDVPCLLLLCEKGRMGDTFPQSLRLIDVRSRTAGKYTCMIQELGRACRYPHLISDRCLIVAENKSVNREELGEHMRTTAPVVLFRPQSVTLDISTMTSTDIAMKSKFLGLAECDVQLDVLVKRARPRDVFLYLQYPLPSLLITDQLAHRFEEGLRRRNDIAVNRGLLRGNLTGAQRTKLLRELPGVTRCISMDLDQYMQQCLVKSKRWPEVDSFLCSKFYRERFVPTDKHFDNGCNDDWIHQRRLLLFAECQMGKTGVFIEFLSQLRERCGVTGFDEESLVEYIPDKLPPRSCDRSTFLLPLWNELFYPHGSLDREYAFPQEGQYHDKIAESRRKRLKESANADTYVAKTCEHECILSHVGQGKLTDCGARADNGLLDLLNWDGKLSKVLKTEGPDAAALASEAIEKWSYELKPVQVTRRHNYSAKVIESQPSGTFPVEPSPVVAATFKPKHGEGSIDFLFSLPPGVDTELLKKRSNLPWVFVPSHNRSEHASLDYSGTLDRGRVVIIVCRQGEQFDKYCKAVGRLHPVLGMPLEFDFKYPGFAHWQTNGKSKSLQMEISAECHKIGHARLFIQLVAREYFELTEAWMLDDNIVSCFDRLADERNGNLDGMRCRFEEAMNAVEVILTKGAEKNIPGNNKPISSLEQIGVSSEFTAGPFPFPRKQSGWTSLQESEDALTVKEYCGHRDNYGVLGIARLDRFGKNSLEGMSKPFSRPTHSMYSFLLLNLKALEDRGVYFPAKPWLEDIEFLHCVHEAGLGVVRFNRFFHTKNHPRPKATSGLVTAFKAIAEGVKAKLDWNHFAAPVARTEARDALTCWRGTVEDLEHDITSAYNIQDDKRLVFVAALHFAPSLDPPFAREVQWAHFLRDDVLKRLGRHGWCIMVYSNDDAFTLTDGLPGFEDWTNDATRELERIATKTSFSVKCFTRKHAGHEAIASSVRESTPGTRARNPAQPPKQACNADGHGLSMRAGSSKTIVPKRDDTDTSEPAGPTAEASTAEGRKKRRMVKSDSSSNSSAGSPSESSSDSESEALSDPSETSSDEDFIKKRPRPRAPSRRGRKVSQGAARGLRTTQRRATGRQRQREIGEFAEEDDTENESKAEATRKQSRGKRDVQDIGPNVRTVPVASPNRKRHTILEFGTRDHEHVQRFGTGGQVIIPNGLRSEHSGPNGIWVTSVSYNTVSDDGIGHCRIRWQIWDEDDELVADEEENEVEVKERLEKGWTISNRTAKKAFLCRAEKLERHAADAADEKKKKLLEESKRLRNREKSFGTGPQFFGLRHPLVVQLEENAHMCDTRDENQSDEERPASPEY